MLLPIPKLLYFVSAAQLARQSLLSPKASAGPDPPLFRDLTWVTRMPLAIRSGFGWSMLLTMYVCICMCHHLVESSRGEDDEGLRMGPGLCVVAVS